MDIKMIFKDRNNLITSFIQHDMVKEATENFFQNKVCLEILSKFGPVFGYKGPIGKKFLDWIAK